MTRLWLALLLAIAPGVGAQGPSSDPEPLEFDSPAQQERFQALTEELRCLVCQNQSLADSDAPLAHDLRREVLVMMREGRSDEDIKTFLVERYGDFVLYRPPVQGNTMILWIAPAVLFLAGAIVVGVNIRRRQRLAADEPRDSDS